MVLSPAGARISVVGFNWQIELEALLFYGLPEAAPAVLLCLPFGADRDRSLALETTWDVPNLNSAATANVDVTVPGARCGDFAAASLDTSRCWAARVLDQQRAGESAKCQRVTAPRGGRAIGANDNAQDLVK